MGINMNTFKLCAFADESGIMIDDQIKALLRNDLCGLEIRNVEGTNISDITPQKAKEVKAKLDANNLTVWSIGSPIGKIDIEKDDFSAEIEKLKATLEIANILEAENIRLFSFYIPKEKNPEDYKDTVLERLLKFTELSGGSKINLCHENEKGIYGDNAARCLEIHKALPDIKAIFDPANFIQCNQDTLEAWELLKQYVEYIHIKDCLKNGSVVPAGKGIGKIPEILKSYKQLGGKALTIEPHLTVFSGLSALEREGEKSKVGNFSYESSEQAFDAACLALKEILKEMLL